MAVSSRDARAAARFLFPVEGRTCAECERAPATELHHWDGNAWNNAATNVLFLCQACHHRTHLPEMVARLHRWHEHQRTRTHCIRGHPLEGENLAIDRKGRRVCRACKAQAQRARRVEVRRTGPGIPRPWARKSHCLRGHPLSGDNLRIDPTGARRCRACAALRTRRARAARKVARPGTPTRTQAVARRAGSKLSERDVAEVKVWVRSGERVVEVARAYGIDKSYVYQLMSGRHRAGVGDREGADAGV
jgi:hypothetical protein